MCMAQRNIGYLRCIVNSGRKFYFVGDRFRIEFRNLETAACLTPNFVPLTSVTTTVTPVST